MLPEPFKYQDYARNKIVARGKTGILAPPGSGKTRPIVNAMEDWELFECKEGPILIICSGPAIDTWNWQLPYWAPEVEFEGSRGIFVAQGTAADRMDIWGQAHNTGEGVYLTNYAVFYRDFGVIRKIPWSIATTDEYHKVMRTRKSTTMKWFTSMTRNMDRMILASGSYGGRPDNLWTLFHMIDPKLKLFRSYWRFVKTFCVVDETEWGNQVIGAKNIAGLKALVDEYVAFIPEAVVAEQLPAGLRSSLKVQMNPQQERIYHELRRDMLAELEDGGLIVAPTSLSKLVKLRQLLCCPKILDDSLGLGAGFEAIVDKMQENSHVVIFVPFRLAVEFIRDALVKMGYEAYMLRGGVSHEEQHDILKRFRTNKGVIVCTIAYAESFDLETCKQSYHLGYEYRLDPNRQAEGRTRRASSTHEFVNWQYVYYQDTIDEHYLELLNTEQRDARRIHSRPDSLIRALQGHEPAM